MWFLRLIRWPNLMIIVLTQVLVRYCVISPFLRTENQHLQLSETGFVLLVLATVLIAAAGYIINDYFDVYIDRVNKPERVIIGKHIDGRMAILLHWILNIAAIIAGFMVSFSTASFGLGLIFPVTAIVLWLYSAKYKRRLITGNLIVSLLSALVVLIVWFFEYFTFIDIVDGVPVISKSISWVVWLYAAFAFFVTLVREIVKDIEDMEGDAAAGCKTIPVVYGIPVSKIIALSITILTILLLAAGQYLLLLQGMKLIAWYYVVPVQVLMIRLVIRIRKAKEHAEFRSPGNLAKVIMVAGILGMLLFPVLMNN